MIYLDEDKNINIEAERSNSNRGNVGSGLPDAAFTTEKYRRNNEDVSVVCLSSNQDLMLKLTPTNSDKMAGDQESFPTTPESWNPRQHGLSKSNLMYDIHNCDIRDRRQKLKRGMSLTVSPLHLGIGCVGRVEQIPLTALLYRGKVRKGC